MRRTRFVVATAAALMPLALAGCDKDDKQKALVDSVVGDAARPVTSTTAAAPREAGASPSPPTSVAMPERPVPKPQTMVTQNAPEEVQIKAIAYMVAMRAPHQDDANADETYATDLVNKLKPIVLAMDKGPDKPRWNRVEMVAKGRQIDMYMSDGCDAKAPFNAVAQRLNVPLTTLLNHGILVLRCNDTKHQCLQSVRDADDVLCTTAPRHK
jgi:hypothetical protein